MNELVRCRRCGHEYICNRENDYYDSTNNSDGLCRMCFRKKEERGRSFAPHFRLKSG